MKPPPFEHHVPESLDEALSSLKALENARILAGGQSLMPMLNLRVAYPDHLIDLNGVKDLAYIREHGEEVSIGAMTRQRAVEFSELVRQRLPLLSEAILSVGHRQTRNRGTVGGSLCHLDPAAEIPLVATTFGATLTVAGADRVRELDIADFAVDMMTPDLEEGEILVEVRFKPWAEGHGWAFSEYSRRAGDFAIVAAAALVELHEDGRIARAVLALGGIAPVAVVVGDAERELVGAFPDEAVIARASAHCELVEPLDDPFAPGWYRQELAAALARRTLARACARAQSVPGQIA